MSIYDRALIFAVQAHEMRPRRPENRTRKYTGDPYVIHPIRVAAMLKSVTPDERVWAAGLLHDVREDTHTTDYELREKFGERVADLVSQVTDVSRPDDGNREERKRIDREHLIEADYDGQNIKLCDLIDNTTSIVNHDPVFARVYLKEKRLLLEVLAKGNPVLVSMAWDTLQKAEDFLRAS